MKGHVVPILLAFIMEKEAEPSRPHMAKGHVVLKVYSLHNGEGGQAINTPGLIRQRNT